MTRGRWNNDYVTEESHGIQGPSQLSGLLQAGFMSPEDRLARAPSITSSASTGRLYYGEPSFRALLRLLRRTARSIIPVRIAAISK